MFPFMFNTYFGRNNTVRILDQVIPKINTISVGDSTPLVGSEISAGNRYWVYYNKCDNVIQVMNHYTVAAAPAA